MNFPTESEGTKRRAFFLQKFPTNSQWEMFLKLNFSFSIAFRWELSLIIFSWEDAMFLVV